MRRLLLLLPLLACLPGTQAETPAAPQAPAPAAQPSTPAAQPAAPAAPSAQPRRGVSSLSADEQRQLRNARAKANKIPEVAAELKAENEAYRVAKEAKDAKKPRAEVDALYAKARALRVAREAKRDAAILAASPELKALVEKARGNERDAGAGAKGRDGKDGEDGRDGKGGKDGAKGKDGDDA